MDLSLLLPIGLIAIFYFMIIMPQKKREKQMKAMLQALKVGDEIVTVGGICGIITILKDDTITIESSADRTKITLERQSIRNVLTASEA